MRKTRAKPRVFAAKKTRAKPIDREGQEQASLMRELALRFPVAAKLIYHVPNGGHRVKTVAAKLKAQGMKAGIPDALGEVRVILETEGLLIKDAA